VKWEHPSLKLSGSWRRRARDEVEKEEKLNIERLERLKKIFVSIRG
jgi:hypothetical protein